ncbi:MAG: hypothetical protein LBU17_05190 [Treponema sp.]|jgi:hypothetical protein|nr:hypothetical protein [Treponema sp.]
MTIEAAWEQLFDRHNILTHVAAEGSFRISATDINQVKEARLMAKFDQFAQLPKIFQKNKLSILPITRGAYLIGHFVTHLRVEYTPVRPIPVKVPELHTLNYTNLYSEAAALLFAYNSGIIEDIMGAEHIHLTVSGRMASGNFTCAVKDTINPRLHHTIQVQNAQIEIDGGYESPEAFCICEAKNIGVEDMLIRQLYYPYRLWKQKISKPVMPVLFIFSNDVFHAFQYNFEDINYCNSIRLVTHRSYAVTDEVIDLTDLITVWKKIKHPIEPDITLPQADSFPRVVDLLSVLGEGVLSREEVTMKYDFDPRQTDYYITACTYLGLVIRSINDAGELEYRLSQEGRSIMAKAYKAKNLGLVQKILERPLFNTVFGLTLRSGSVPDKQAICRIMAQRNLAIHYTTIERRSSTIRGWITWIMHLTDTPEPELEF